MSRTKLAPTGNVRNATFHVVKVAVTCGGFDRSVPLMNDAKYIGLKTSPDFLKEKGTLRGALASLIAQPDLLG